MSLPDTISSIVRVCKWVPVIYKDRDWDYVYMLETLEYKLQRMRSNMKYTQNTKLMQIDYALLLLDRILRHDYLWQEYAMLRKKYGKTRYAYKPYEKTDMVITTLTYPEIGEELQELARVEWYNFYVKQDKAENDDYTKLFKHIGTFIRNWWD